jgi:hypothetical protein
MFTTTNSKPRLAMDPKPRRGTALCVAAIAAFSLCGLIGASAASAASPWWHLGIAARPTNIQAGVAKSEVQEISVPSEAVFELLVEGKSAGEFGTEPYAAFFGLKEPTAANVQQGLEGVYGKGNVLVTREPGVGAPLIVTSVGERAERAVPAIGIASEPLLGAVQAKVLTSGHADGEIVFTAANLGDAPANGEASTVRIADRLPAHLQAVSVEGVAGNTSFSPGPVTCSIENAGKTVGCSYANTLVAYDQIEVRVGVLVEAGASGSEINEASISGGEAPSASIHRPVAIGGEETKFGIENYELTPEAEGGAAVTQAGSHPFQLTTTLALNENGKEESAAPPKDLSFKWPPGLIGNPTAIPRCTLGQFLRFEGVKLLNGCPPQSAVGVAIVTIREPAGNLGTAAAYPLTVPLFNLEPEKGEPARFGFLAPGTPVVIDASVRTGSDYGITVKTDNISETAAFLKAEVVVWGAPGEASHDASRGNGCVRSSIEHENLPCQPLEEQHPSAFLSLPTSCPKTSSGEPEALTSIVEGDSWAEPHPAEPVHASATLGPFDGCNQIPFEPSLTVTPNGTAGSTPTGLTTDVHVPQEDSLSPNGIAEGDVQNITVALPAGLALNPAAADGLAACTEAQIGYQGKAADGTDLFNAGEPSCPDSSKVGNVTITTPVLAHPLTGYVYLAAPQNFTGAPQENPFESLVAMYLVARDPVSGVLVKLPGSVALSGTGQITATFNDTPQVPFEDASLEFYGGDRAPLATPARCGSYATNAVFTPWSLQEGGSPTPASASFNIESGPNGSACPGSSLPFAPSLTAGTTNVNAGAFSPLTTTITREDGQQDISSVKLHLPAGLSGILAGVKLCPEAQANAGTCGQESKIGSTIVSVGLGGDSYTVTGGEVFLTEKIAGTPADAPFGLSIVNPAVAGPFNLGKVVVRARIEVDPHTTELTATTNSEAEGHAIPHILDGIPLQIKHVNVTVERKGFTFNPTSCAAKTITGSVGSSEGASSNVSVPFAVTNCAALKFAPKFTVSTSGKTSKAKGASLTATLTYPKAAQGTQTNIARVKVDLPKQLPSRLTTLQKACTSKQFEANPANCPAASKIGYAKVTTPLLPVPLEGPAIFVSHGGEAFPSLTMVLQGYGVTVDLVGTTFISKAGITSTTFKTVPDTPFSTFELTLPQGKFSALAANGNLCKSKLAMPTEFLAQNGLKINESTPIGVSGCSTGISIVSHKIKGRTLTVSVSVPAAGILTASGNGLSRSSKSAKGRETLTFKLTQKKPGKLSTKLKIAFKPSKGGKQAKSLSVKFKK